MSYNRSYGRYSGRYNKPGRFVAASQSEPRWNLDNMGHMAHMPQINNMQFNNPVTKGQLKMEQQQPQEQPPIQHQQPQSNPEPQQEFPQQPDAEPQKPQELQPPEESPMETKPEVTDTDASPFRPFWMKSKLQGVKKINNRERRRRQNETLRRLLAPKNALMVLNEMHPGDTLASQFKMEAVSAGSPVRAPHAYCAQLTLQQQTYTGYGETKTVARNAAAEQAIRDLMIQRMERALQERERQDVLLDTESKKSVSGEPEMQEAGTGQAGAEPGTEMETEAEGVADSLPMIQLASFALHKLFAEWECGGHRVPQLKNNGAETVEGQSARPKERTLPPHAAIMHPCSLLTHMRPSPQQAYRELPPEGTLHGTLFAVALDIDGHTYMGKASSKKEARRVAARAACEALFGVRYEPPH